MTTGKNEALVRSWDNLPAQVLEVIKSKLCSANLIRFRAVCRRWREIGNKQRPISKLPWPAGQSCKARLTCAPPKFEMEFKVFDPNYEGKIHSANFDVPESSSYLTYCPDLRYDSRVYASKRGWVLVEEESPVGSRSINLYNPFSKTNFPSPSNYENFRVTAATFSDEPTSPACALFVAFEGNLGTNYIGTYQNSYEKWDWTVYEISEGWFTATTVKSMAYCEGEAILYFVFEDGTLGTFDPLEKNSPTIYEETGFRYPIDSIHLVEYEGDIILASGIVNQGSRTSWHGYHWIVSKFNRDAMSWVSEGLEGRTLFVSDASFCVPVVGNLDGCVCNFFDGKCWRIYNLKDHWYVPPESFGWRIEDVVGDGDGGGEKSFWIEPPHLET